MNVYYNGNGNIWGRGKHKNKLTCFPIRQTFLWEGQEMFAPAVYVGAPGIVLDICAKISSEDMIAFLNKWNYKKRLSMNIQQTQEILDAENPGSREFKVETNLDGLPLTLKMYGSARWYPDSIIIHMDMGENTPAQSMQAIPAKETNADTMEQLTTADSSGANAKHLTCTTPDDDAKHSSMAWTNDSDAEALMDAYDLDRNCCWHLQRLVYCWKEDPVLSPHKISLHFQACPISVIAEHFTTDLSCKEKTLKIIHPQTGREYTLTLHKCEQMRTSFAPIAQEGMCYPENSMTLFYSIFPECDRDLVHIQDLSQSEPPKQADLSAGHWETIGHHRYATSVFIAGKSPEPDKEIAISSLHFDPVTEVHWQVTFHVNPREDMKISFPILNPIK